MLTALLSLVLVGSVLTTPWAFRWAYNIGWRRARSLHVAPERCRAPIDAFHERCVGLSSLVCQDVLCVQHCHDFHEERCFKLIGSREYVQAAPPRDRVVAHS